MTALTVVIPTVDGRGEHLDRILTAIRDIPALQVVKVWNRPTCGEAWQEGIEQARGVFTCCLADDLCPLTEDWYIQAAAAWDEGWCPVPRIWDGNTGEIESAGVWRKHFPDRTVVPMSTIPFFRTDFWKGHHIMPQVHYESDVIFSNWCRDVGRQCAVVHGFDFTHHWAQERRHPAP